MSWYLFDENDERVAGPLDTEAAEAALLQAQLGEDNYYIDLEDE